MDTPVLNNDAPTIFQWVLTRVRDLDYNLEVYKKYKTPQLKIFVLFNV